MLIRATWEGAVKLTAASVCILALMAVPTLADENMRWATSGDWDIRVDKSVGGCYMIASYTKGEIIRLGFDSVNKNGYLWIANKVWRSVEVGKEYKLSFEFDGESPWTGVFRAIDLGDGLKALSGSFDKPGFMQDFGAKQKVNVYYEGKFVATLPLTGSFAAMQSLIECQSKVDEVLQSAPNSSPDPFSGSGDRPASDPFSPNAR
jgi:hypothetical protein